MFQFLLAERLHMHRGTGFSFVLFVLIWSVKGKDGVPQKDKFEKYLDLVACLRS